MTFRHSAFAAVLALMAVVSPAGASDPAGYRDYVKKGAYATVRADLEDEIIAKGFVIDHLGRFNQMLERTAKAAGKSAALPYVDAEYLQFCPTGLTHEAVGVSPFHIANCPITLYVFELKAEPGTVHVGYRLPAPSSDPGVQKANGRLVEMLDGIAGAVTK